MPTCGRRSSRSGSASWWQPRPTGSTRCSARTGAGWSAGQRARLVAGAGAARGPSVRAARRAHGAPRRGDRGRAARDAPAAGSAGHRHRGRAPRGSGRRRGPRGPAPRTRPGRPFPSTRRSRPPTGRAPTSRPREVADPTSRWGLRTGIASRRALGRRRGRVDRDRGVADHAGLRAPAGALPDGGDRRRPPVRAGPPGPPVRRAAGVARRRAPAARGAPGGRVRRPGAAGARAARSAPWGRARVRRGRRGCAGRRRSCGCGSPPGPRCWSAARQCCWPACSRPPPASSCSPPPWWVPPEGSSRATAYVPPHRPSWPPGRSWRPRSRRSPGACARWRCGSASPTRSPWSTRPAVASRPRAPARCGLWPAGGCWSGSVAGWVWSRSRQRCRPAASPPRSWPCSCSCPWPCRTPCSHCPTPAPPRSAPERRGSGWTSFSPPSRP